MREPSLSEAAFPTARCVRCDKAVLTYLELDADGEEKRLCVHCEGLVEPTIQWVTADELEASGYYFGSEPPASKASGCGSSCGSCSTRKH